MGQITQPVVQVAQDTLAAIRERVTEKNKKKTTKRASSVQDDENIIKRVAKKHPSNVTDDNSKSSIQLYRRYQIRDTSAKPRNRFEKIGSRDYQVQV